MGSSLHLVTDSGEIHLNLLADSDAQDVLTICIEAMKGARVVEFPNALAPRAVARTTVVVNFARVSAAWVEPDAA